MSKAGKFKRSFCLALLALVLALPEWAAAQAPFKRLVVFGDSLSDPGNAFALLGATNTPPDYSVDPFLVPDRPYARGGQHFSNGATWIEQLARPFGLAGNARPALRAPNGSAANYAVGGARARDDQANFNLPQQVSAFLNKSGGVARSDALYVVAIGGNDVRDALVAYLTAFQATLMAGGSRAAAEAAGMAAANDVLTPAVMSIGANMQSLAVAGAQGFFVWKLPNIGLTPAIGGLASTNPAIGALANGLTVAFNSAVEAKVFGPLEASGLRIVRLDVYGKVQQMVDYAAEFGLTNVTGACITPSVAPFACRNPDDYLFWDGIHPTAAAHAILAQEAAYVLTH